MIRRLVKVILISAALVGLVQGVVWYLESNGFFERRIRSGLERYVAGEVAVGSTDFRVLSWRLDTTDLVLSAGAAGGGRLEIPESSFQLPLDLAGGGEIIPDRVEVVAPLLYLEEREDGTFSPLDLIKPWVPTARVPVTMVADGTVALGGEGRVNRFLDDLFRADLKRRIDRVRLVTFPQPPPSPELLGFSGTLSLPGLTEVAVSGGLGRDNSFRLIADLVDLSLDDEQLLAELSPRLAELLHAHQVAGRVAVHATVSSAPTEVIGSEPVDIYCRLTLADIGLRHPAFERPFVALGGAATFDGSTLRLHELTIPDGPDRLILSGLWQDVLHDGDWCLTIRGDHVRTHDSLVSALVEPRIRRAIDDFSPAGTVEFFGEVARKRGGSAEVRWRILPLTASASYVGHPSRRTSGRNVGFPYRLHDLTGEVSGFGRTIEIRSLRGRHNGDGFAVIDGFVDALDDHSVFEVSITAAGVPLDVTLRDALEYVAPGSGPLYDRFAPQGTVDLDLVVSSDPGGGDAHVHGRIETRDGRACFDGFPYPLEDLSGAVEVAGDRYRITELTGRNGDTRVTVSGTVEGMREAMSLDLRIAATGVRTGDEQFRAAIDAVASGGPSVLREVFDKLVPDGTFDLDVEVRQVAGGEPRFRAVLFPRDLRLVPSWFPIPIQGVLGRVTFGNLHDHESGDSRGYLHVDRLEGRFGDVAVSAWGRLGDDIRDSLHVVGRDVRLSDELLGHLLAAAGQVIEQEGRAALGLLRDLSVAGGLSFHYRHGAAADGGLGRPGRDTLDLDLDRIDCRAGVLPGGGISGLSGRASVDFDADRIDLIGIRADLPGTLGPVRSDHLRMSLGPSRVQISGDIDLGRKPFSADLAALVPPAIREYFVASDPSGSFTSHLSRLDLELRRRGVDQPLEVGELFFEGDARIEDCALQRPVGLTNVNARIGLSGEGSLAEGGRFVIRGRLEDLAFSAGLLTFRDLTADLSITGDVVEVRNLGGPFAGGRLPPRRNHLRVETAPDGDVTGDLVIEDADLQQLARDVMHFPDDISGRVSLDFELDGRKSDLGAVGGEGRITIEDGELWELPLFAALYEFSLGLALGGDDLPKFEKGTIEFRVVQGVVIIDWFELKSPLSISPVGLTLTGDGVLGPTGVDLRVVPQVIPFRVPLLWEAIHYLKLGLINYRVFGPLSNPRVAYWNAAVDVMAPDQDVTRLPRLAPRQPAHWERRF